MCQGLGKLLRLKPEEGLPLVVNTSPRIQIRPTAHGDVGLAPPRTGRAVAL